MLGLRVAPRVWGQFTVEGGEHGARRAVARGVDSWLVEVLLLGQFVPSGLLRFSGLVFVLQRAVGFRYCTRHGAWAWFIGFSAVSSSPMTSTSTWLRHEVR